MPTTIFDIPPEVIEQILLELDPLDVAACSQTCRDLHTLVDHPSNGLFWRRLYLAQPFDDPLQCRTSLGEPIADFDWRGTLQRIIRARTIVENRDRCRPEERCAVIQTLLDMARRTLPLVDNFSSDSSLNLAWLASTLRGSAFLDRPPWVSSREETLLREHLHTLFGLTTDDLRAKPRLQSRSFIYDFRNYCAANDWAPLLPDGSGRVNWEHVRAIHHVISLHMVPLEEPSAESYTIRPMSLPFSQSILDPGLDLNNTEDWADVTGRWRYVYCFVDHWDLLAFNMPAYNAFSGNVANAHDPAFFDNPDVAEIFGNLTIEIKVKSTEPDPEHPTRPIIHFEGVVEDSPGVTGWVRVTSDDNIRWYLETGDGNAGRVWGSRGIQVGNVRSLFGVLGTWSPVTHEEGDPVGPFWLRKTYA